MTDSLPTHPASTDSPAEGGAVFGYWVEHTVAEPMLIRPPAFVPAGPNYTITPLFTRPAPIEPGVPSREMVQRAIHDWVRDDAPINQKMTWTPALNRALEDRILALFSSNTGEG